MKTEKSENKNQKSETKNENKVVKNNKNNVITFSNFCQQSGFLTENEINNLFMGLLNLIKKSVVFEKEKHYKQQINSFNKKFAEYVAFMEEKNREIFNLKAQIKTLSENLHK